jgi:hypothetical protein
MSEKPKMAVMVNLEAILNYAAWKILEINALVLLNFLHFEKLYNF